MLAKGCSLEELKAKTKAMGGTYVEAEARDQKLDEVNDIQGAIVFDREHFNTPLPERLPVLKDTVVRDGVAHELYFVFGHAHRLVGIDDIVEFDAAKYETQSKSAGKQPQRAGGSNPREFKRMSTSFRTHLLVKSKESCLYARTRLDESNRPVMPVPPNAMPFPIPPKWANDDFYLKGFGQPPEVQRNGIIERSEFPLGHVEYNKLDDVIIIFWTGEEAHEAGRPTQQRRGKTIPASSTVSGRSIAIIQGKRSIEVMAPAGKVAGVKGASFRSVLSREKNTVLRVTTHDGAIHQITFTDTGLRIEPISPGGAVLAPTAHGDVSVYSYQAFNTGPRGSIKGYAYPEIIFSNEQAVPAGIFAGNPVGMWATMKDIASFMTNVLTLQPSVGNPDTWLGGALSVGVKATTTAGYVFAMTNALDAWRASTPTGTILGGHTVFSASGAGSVSPATLGKGVFIIVLLQNMISHASEKAYAHLMPDELKVTESMRDILRNDYFLPYLVELGRQELNYGVEKKAVGMPRGDHRDPMMLLATAFLGVFFVDMAKRGGATPNRPVTAAIFLLLAFVLADLLPRALGAALSNPNGRPGELLPDFNEATIVRLFNRVDKWLIPLIGIMLSGLGLAGANADPTHAQRNYQNRFNGLGGNLRNLANELTQWASVQAQRAEQGLKWDVDTTASIMSKLRHASHRLHLMINLLTIKSTEAQGEEFELVKRGSGFSQWDKPKQDKFVAEISDGFQQSVSMSSSSKKNSTGIMSASRGETSATTKPQVAESAQDAPEDEITFAEQLSAEPETIDENEATAQSVKHAEHYMEFTNYMGNLPGEMAKHFDNLMGDFITQYDPNDATAPKYPLEMSFDLETQRRFDAKPSRIPGVRTPVIPQDFTTFSNRIVEPVYETHDVVAEESGIPKSPDDSLPHYQRLDGLMVKLMFYCFQRYGELSGPFHYKFRWDKTGQPVFTEIVKNLGIHLETSAVNQPDNPSGDPGKQVTAIMGLIINLAALHAKIFPGLHHRAAVTEAHYYDAGELTAEKLAELEKQMIKHIQTGDLVGLSEILSSSVGSALTPGFLVTQGASATDNARRQHFVIDNKGAGMSIANSTAKRQAETVTLSGAAYIVEDVTSNPPKPKPPEGKKAMENLGQVVHLSRVDLWQMQRNHRDFMKNDLSRLQNGTLMMNEQGHIFAYRRGKELEPKPAFNYYLGTTLDEAGSENLSRLLYPFTSENSPRGIREEINHALVTTGMKWVRPYLNDMIKNTTYERDRMNDGYYDPENPYRLEDEQRWNQIASRAGEVTTALNNLVIDQPFPELNRSPALFKGQMLAEVTSSALRKALTIICTDKDGKIERDNGWTPDLKTAGQLKTVCNIHNCFDKVDLQHDNPGPGMVGLGPNGFYAIGWIDFVPQALPVQIEGNGHTPGNLLHAISATYPNPGGTRYRMLPSGIKAGKKDGWQLKLERHLTEPARNSLEKAVVELLDVLKEYAASPYDPMTEWLATKQRHPNAGISIEAGGRELIGHV